MNNNNNISAMPKKNRRDLLKNLKLNKLKTKLLIDSYRTNIQEPRPTIKKYFFSEIYKSASSHNTEKDRLDQIDKELDTQLILL